MSFGKGRRSSSLMRTTSMKGFDLDISIVENPQESNKDSESEMFLTSRTTEQYQHQHQQQQQQQEEEKSVWGGDDGMDLRFLSSSSKVSPRKPRRSSCDFAPRRSSCDFAQVLRTCGLCNRRIGSKKDIYMYRGEVAFCSMECRQKQMGIDERTEKSLITGAMRNDSDDPKQKISGSDGSSGDGTVFSA